MSQGKVYTGQEVAKHNSKESCWIIVHGRSSRSFHVESNTQRPFSGKVYDVTDFLPGMSSLLVFTQRTDKGVALQTIQVRGNSFAKC